MQKWLEQMVVGRLTTFCLGGLVFSSGAMLVLWGGGLIRAMLFA